MSTLGPDYSSQIDGERLRKQHEQIRQLMLDGNWRTLREISFRLGYPESSVSAQLRHLRKAQFGGYRVEKKRHGHTGLWAYHVSEPLFKRLPDGQMAFA